MFDFMDTEPDSSGVVFRPYQEQMASETIRRIVKLKERGVLNIAPMGCGKSLTMGKTAVDFAEATGKGVLILAHFKRLVKQNHKAANGLGRRCYLYHGEKKDVIWSDVLNNGALVSGGVAAILKALPKLDPNAFGLILIDEGHHAAPGSAYATIQKHFGCPVALYSATPDGATGPLVGDGALCESIAFNGQVRQFVREGWILRPKIIFEKAVNLKYSLLPADGSEVTEKQANAVWMANRSHFAVIKPFLERCGQMQSIGFAPSVALAKHWNDLVNEKRRDLSAYVASYKPGDYTGAKLSFDTTERERIESLFEQGIKQYLWNQGVYLEGADLTAATVCMLGILSTSRSKIAQAIGRVLRPADVNGQSILVGLENATNEARLEAIAKSKKPCAYVFDYRGSTGPQKLVHTIDIFSDPDNPIDERLRQKIIEEGERKAGRDGDVDIETLMLEQEELHKQFTARDISVRRSMAIECDVLTRDIDPFGPPEIAGHERYTTRKINPPPQRVIDEIRKITKELGKNYSHDFYATLTNKKGFSVLGDLRKQRDAKRKKEPCPGWLYNKLEAKGIYSEFASYHAGLAALHGKEK